MMHATFKCKHTTNRSRTRSGSRLGLKLVRAIGVQIILFPMFYYSVIVLSSDST